MICDICGKDIRKTDDPYCVLEFITERRQIHGEIVRELANSAKNVYCSQLCLYEQVKKGIEEFQAL